jgi:hypothetical protein
MATSRATASRSMGDVVPGGGHLEVSTAGSRHNPAAVVDLSKVIIRDWRSGDHSFAEVSGTHQVKEEKLRRQSSYRRQRVRERHKKDLKLAWIHIPDNDESLCEVSTSYPFLRTLLIAPNRLFWGDCASIRKASSTIS